jgi:cytidylate kinase
MPSDMPESIIEKMIAEKIAKWASRKEKPAGKEQELHPFIAISRDFGCGEEELIPALEKAFGWKVYGKNILDAICQREGLSREFMDTVDEHSNSTVNAWIQHLIHSGSILQQDYVIQISKFMRVIASNESAIFLGRGSVYILADRPEGKRVHLTAPFEKRVEHIQKLRNLNHGEAEALVKETDTHRAEFIQKNFNRKYGSPLDFDLVLNTERLTVDKICQVLKTLIQ